MEQFGLWNLLKTMLSQGESPAEPSEKEPPQAPPPTENPVTEEEKPNACEDFLLRHERLSQSRKK